MLQSPRAGREGDVLAVVSQSGPTVSFFDAASDRHLGDVHVPAEPHELCFDATRRLLWCTLTYHSGYYHANAGRRTELAVIDPDTRRIVEIVDVAPEHGPHGLALDAGLGRLYVSVESGDDRPGGVVVIDTATRRPIGRIDTDAPGPHWFAIDPAGRTGYATNKEAPFVSVVDLERGVLTAKVEVPGSEGLAVSPTARTSTSPRRTAASPAVPVSGRPPVCGSSTRVRRPSWTPCPPRTWSSRCTSPPRAGCSRASCGWRPIRGRSWAATPRAGSRCSTQAPASGWARPRSGSSR